MFSQPVTYIYSLLPTSSANMHMTLYLLVPASNLLSIPLEIQHISDWATGNNLRLNNSKSQEMIVHLLWRRRHLPYPIAIPGIKRVDKMNILGITVSHTLTFHHHIYVPVTKFAHSVYALKTTLMGSRKCMWDVTHATLVPQLLYAIASLAWWGYLKADERNWLQSIIAKVK